jgi:septal ring factor EnvC (AmiA/AmiB activator)
VSDHLKKTYSKLGIFQLRTEQLTITSKYRKGSVRMSNRIKELPSRRTLKNLQAVLGEMSKNIEDLQSKFSNIYANDKSRDLQHTQLSGKVEELKGWAGETKKTLEKVLSAMKYMQGENESTITPNRQRNSQRIRRNR